MSRSPYQYVYSDAMYNNEILDCQFSIKGTTEEGISFDFRAVKIVSCSDMANEFRAVVHRPTIDADDIDMRDFSSVVYAGTLSSIYGVPKFLMPYNKKAIRLLFKLEKFNGFNDCVTLWLRPI